MRKEETVESFYKETGFSKMTLESFKKVYW